MSNGELAELLIDVEDNEIMGILYYAMDGSGYESFEDAKKSHIRLDGQGSGGLNE